MYFNVNKIFFNNFEITKEKKDETEIEKQIKNEETKFEKILKEEVEENKKSDTEDTENNKTETTSQVDVSTMIAKTNSIDYTNGLAASYIRNYILNKYRNGKE
ncbi:MAG: hypothetical protein PWP46_1155 [Fusobacteriaceae bacterium]|jgi:hypothetical protein|nr:hypothetical protein [Fusobacteriaceae bacterium]